MKIEQIAEVCHETNRAYCRTIGDDSQQPWLAAPEWQRTSAVNGVIFKLQNPDALPKDALFIGVVNALRDLVKTASA